MRSFISDNPRLCQVGDCKTPHHSFLIIETVRVSGFGFPEKIRVIVGKECLSAGRRKLRRCERKLLAEAKDPFFEKTKRRKKHRQGPRYGRQRLSLEK